MRLTTTVIFLASCLISFNVQAEQRINIPKDRTANSFGQQVQDHYRAKPGEQFFIRGFYNNLGRNCETYDVPDIAVVQRPKHGKLAVRMISGRPTYPRNDPRHKCNNRSIPKRGLFYTSDAKFTGRDQIVLKATRADDPQSFQVLRVTIDVSK